MMVMQCTASSWYMRDMFGFQDPERYGPKGFNRCILADMHPGAHKDSMGCVFLTDPFVVLRNEEPEHFPVEPGFDDALDRAEEEVPGDTVVLSVQPLVVPKPAMPAQAAPAVPRTSVTGAPTYDDPDPQDHVVVTTYQRHDHLDPITHIYGPYTKEGAHDVAAKIPPTFKDYIQTGETLGTAVYRLAPSPFHIQPMEINHHGF